MKRLMTTTGLIGVLLSMVMAISPAQAQDTENPYQLIQGVADKTFNRIKQQRDTIESNPDHLRTIVEQELLPYVDYKFAALKVLGRHFKSVPREKLGEYIKVFREYLVTTYALAMAQYDEQEVVFQQGMQYDGEKVVTVRALVKEDGRPDIKIAFKVRKDSQTEQWKAYDMVAEGISMLSSKQSEMEPLLRQEGIEAVMAKMREKNEQDINLKREGSKE
ncbi:putative phospholipid-binding protein MlaC [Saliniradius amylolyticus]|uniref:Putative phospholipid-binding protein MlaC n=1 Tax=Saliniradius amylolyticus TaxID=2183582 RepID=A0A2S2E5M2_9ALTE|nr:ABC transporter substrate-binding protein [Saliniradius amylolyticus]AWL12955.1 putative phospholipid-binding protein MlaC [Saliniradius amylolyticus]